MKIGSLRAGGMEGVDITGQVVEIVEKTEVETRFGKSRLTVVIISDEIMHSNFLPPAVSFYFPDLLQFLLNPAEFRPLTKYLLRH